jgi:hypothetical protein
MLMRRRVALLAFSAAVGGTCALASSAQSDDAIRVRIDYVAAPGCPSRERLFDEIRTRAPRVVDARAGDDAIGVVVRVARDKRGFAGSVALRFGDAPAHARTINGASCEEVVAGLALMAAVGVDAAVGASASASASPGGASSGAPSRTTDAAAVGDSRDASAAYDAGSVDASVAVEDAAPATVPRATPPAPWQTSVGAEASLVASPAPATLVTALVFVDTVRRASAFSASARLRLERSLHDNAAATSPDAAFTWTAASLDLCPYALRVGAHDPLAPEPLRIEPCARVHGALLDVTGTNVAPTRDNTRPWGALGPVARVRWAFAPPASLEVEGALVFPLVRDRFFAQPNATIYRPPIVGWSVAAGASFAIF